MHRGGGDGGGDEGTGDGGMSGPGGVSGKGGSDGGGGVQGVAALDAVGHGSEEHIEPIRSRRRLGRRGAAERAGAPVPACVRNWLFW